MTRLLSGLDDQALGLGTSLQSIAEAALPASAGPEAGGLSGLPGIRSATRP